MLNKLITLQVQVISCIVLFCCRLHYCLFSFSIFSLLATSSINRIWIWIRSHNLQRRTKQSQVGSRIASSGLARVISSLCWQ